MINMHTVSTYQILDILHFNDIELYFAQNWVQFEKYFPNFSDIATYFTGEIIEKYEKVEKKIANIAQGNVQPLL